MDYFERKLDDKRRLTIPAELRAELASGVVITRGFEDYLHLYPRHVWDQDMEPALQGNILSKEIADLNAQFRRGKVDASIDGKQGRITLEAHHLEYSGIERDIEAVRVGRYWRVQRKGWSSKVVG